MEVESTYRFMEATGCPGIGDGSVTEELLHIVITAYFEGGIEVIRHRMDRETAGKSSAGMQPRGRVQNFPVS